LSMNGITSPIAIRCPTPSTALPWSNSTANRNLGATWHCQEATVSDQTTMTAQEFRQFLVAQLLLRAAVARLMLLDPGFAQDDRQWLDHMLGRFSTSDDVVDVDPHAMSELREHYVVVLEQAELLSRLVTSREQPSPTPKPKSLRRRIFEWFERG